MTAYAVPGSFLLYPDPWPINALVANSNPIVSRLIDASTEKFAMTFVVPKDGTLKCCHFRTATVNTGDTVRVSFQDIDPTTGFPDGVQDQYRNVSIASTDDNVWVSPLVMTSDGTDTGAKRSVTKGQQIAVVIEYPSYVAGSINIVDWGSNGRSSAFYNHQHTLHNTGGAWVFCTAAPVGALEYDDGSFGFIPNAFPYAGLQQLGHHTGTSPDEVGNRFTTPASVGLRVIGFWTDQTTQEDSLVKLYDAADNVLASYTFDKNLIASSATCSMGYLSSPVDLAVNALHRLTKQATSGTTITTQYALVNAAAWLDQSQCGQDMHWTQRTDAGAWSQVTTRRATIGLIVSDLIIASGGVSRSRVVN